MTTYGEPVPGNNQASYAQQPVAYLQPVVAVAYAQPAIVMQPATTNTNGEEAKAMQNRRRVDDTRLQFGLCALCSSMLLISGLIYNLRNTIMVYLNNSTVSAYTYSALSFYVFHYCLLFAILGTGVFAWSAQTVQSLRTAMRVWKIGFPLMIFLALAAITVNTLMLGADLSSALTVYLPLAIVVSLVSPVCCCAIYWKLLSNYKESTEKADPETGGA